MVFFTRYWNALLTERAAHAGRRAGALLRVHLLALGLFFGVLGASIAPAQAATDAFELTAVALKASPTEPDRWVLSADFEIGLGPALEEAVNRGLPLYFVAEFELMRPRWWWWDERVRAASRTWRLSYHALTRQYRVALGSYVQRFSTLGEALESITRIRGWPVIDHEKLRPGEVYTVAVRLRLDSAQLPKPLQMSAITSRDWNPTAEWTRFPFTPEIAKSAQ